MIWFIVAAVMAALNGYSILPQPLVHELARAYGPANRHALTDTEEELLRCLAAGRTVAEVAAHMNYSVRETHRKLRRLYAAIGASNRAAAICSAAAWGLAPSIGTPVNQRLRSAVPADRS